MENRTIAETIAEIEAALDRIEAMVAELRGAAAEPEQAAEEAAESPEAGETYFTLSPESAYIVALEIKMNDAIDEQRRHIFNPDPRPFEKLAAFFQKGAEEFGREWTEERFEREADSQKGDRWSVAHELVERVLAAA